MALGSRFAHTLAADWGLNGRPMISTRTAFLVFATMMASGCAAVADLTNEPAEAREYRTGSHLPLRDRGAPIDVKIIDPDALTTLRQLPGARAPGKGE